MITNLAPFLYGDTGDDLEFQLVNLNETLQWKCSGAFNR